MFQMPKLSMVCCLLTIAAVAQSDEEVATAAQKFQRASEAAVEVDVAGRAFEQQTDLPQNEVRSKRGSHHRRHHHRGARGHQSRFERPSQQRVAFNNSHRPIQQTFQIDQQQAMHSVPVELHKLMRNQAETVLARHSQHTCPDKAPADSCHIMAHRGVYMCKEAETACVGSLGRYLKNGDKCSYTHECPGLSGHLQPHNLLCQNTVWQSPDGTPFDEMRKCVAASSLVYFLVLQFSFSLLILIIAGVGYFRFHSQRTTKDAATAPKALAETVNPNPFLVHKTPFY